MRGGVRAFTANLCSKGDAWRQLLSLEGFAYKHDMKWILRTFGALYAVVALLFVLVAGWLLFSAAGEIWNVFSGATADAQRVPALIIIESLGQLAVALVALEIAQTIFEEQVIRREHVSAPTRVRRYLSRFLVVIIVAMTIETLVTIVVALREDRAQLVYAAWIGFATALLLTAWGIFIRLNRSAEEIEPEAMREAKKEDEKLRD